MDISRELAITILKYLSENKNFYFPFLVMNQEYSPEDTDFVEIEPSEWQIIKEDENYKTFQLWENLQGLKDGTTELLAQGFIELITKQSLESHIGILAENYRKQYQGELSESEKIEAYGLNEFIGGKADAYEDCLYLVRKYQSFRD